jgi:pimeloyl-ACP methyl ester carboxylesterase
MPLFKRDNIEIYYEAYGEGFPVLMLAPGGMRSAIDFWNVAPWNPLDQLAKQYHVIAMDQRNAGQSVAPIKVSDGWQTYTEDQLGLVDYLGIDKFHIVGMCIGGPYAMGLIEAAPERVASAVLFQTIGLDNNHTEFYEMFDNFANEQKETGHTDVPDSTWAAFRSSMLDGDFLFNAKADREFLSRCQTPLLVFKGNDVYHPDSISREVAELAPNAVLIENWKEEEFNEAAKLALEEFLNMYRI